jgi:hypothetical protein
MNISLGTIIPPSAVLAVAGWSCWTIVGASVPPPAKPKPVESAAGLLEPELGTLAERDPFALPGEPEPDVKKAGAAAAKPEESTAAKLRRMMADVNKRLLAVRAAEAKKAAERAAARDRLAHIPLAATSIHGDRRTAILAGHVYAQGETLHGTEATLGPVVLADVRPDGVTLHAAAAGNVAVEFPETSAKRTTHAAAHVTATPRKSRRPQSKGGVVTLRGKAR